MDGDAGDLGKAFFDEVFEGGKDVVDTDDGVLTFHDAMAGDKDVVVHLANTDIVAVEKFVVVARHVIEEYFDGEFKLAHFTDADFWSGNVTAERLNMDIDVELVVALADGSDGGFELRGLAMGFAERKIFVNFEVKLDEEIAVLLVGGDVVNRIAHALGDSANGFEQIFVVGRTGFGVDDNIGGDDLADAVLDGIGKRVDLLEIGGTGNGDSGVDKVAIAGAADTNAFDVKDAVHAADGIDDFILQAFGGGVEEGVESAAAELRADPENDASDREAGKCVRVN